MIIETIEDAKASVKSICDRRKQALVKLLEAVDEYAHGSLSPDEFEDYEKTKSILVQRHSQHEDLV